MKLRIPVLALLAAFIALPAYGQEKPCELTAEMLDPAVQVPEFYGDANLVYVGVTAYVTGSGIAIDTVPASYKQPNAGAVIVIVAMTRVVDFKLDCEIMVQFTFVRKNSTPPRARAETCEIQWASMLEEKPADGVYAMELSDVVPHSGPPAPSMSVPCYAIAEVVHANGFAGVDTALERWELAHVRH